MARICSEPLADGVPESPGGGTPDPWLRDPNAIAEAERIIRRYAALRLPRHDAEDLVQDVFLRFYSRPQRAGPIRNITAFLRRTARNLMIDRFRMPALLDFVGDDVLNAIPDGNASPESIVFTQQAMDAMERVLLAMPELTRKIFYMHRFEGLTCRELAFHLKLPRSTVHDHLSRALDALVRATLPYLKGLE